MPKFTDRYEPCLIVRNFSGNFEDLLKKRQLEETQLQALRLWRANASMKHTTTTSVRTLVVGKNNSGNNLTDGTPYPDYLVPDYPGDLPETPGEPSPSQYFQILN
ncbi:hypothetical protein [Sneathiella sp. HT1-7]|uniref:hypothetical protein n=1 Tax=Sneathiella sp. HT1-7 TaxID=2887192 RepID=UPI001D13B19C|nr:hypothetical protein [Sneathiella sp. HT1-7]MCC3303824.1 hypothetical protein [Sneathiella sp. HT1-7]